MKERGPASRAVTVIRTGVTTPSAGSVIESRDTIAPPSSTTSGTRLPPKPRCRIERSATSEPPFNTECDASTRRISMSLSNLSAPNPTVNTGTERARSDSSSSPIGTRELSAPSESTTRPDSGTPSSSWRACSTASPRCVWLASNPELRHAVDALRAAREPEQADDELLPECLEQRAVRPAERMLHPPLRALPSRSATRMLRESSINTPT